MVTFSTRSTRPPAGRFSPPARTLILPPGHRRCGGQGQGRAGELDASQTLAEILGADLPDDIAALVLSCPGPMLRHHASLLPISQLALPQCLLGSEAQLFAFAAALPKHLAARCVFAPLPEMFAGPLSLQSAWSACGVKPPPHRVTHLRFGSVRTARILKGAQNIAVVAEHLTQPPLATSGHPFASGLSLPAAMQRVLAYAPFETSPVRVDGKTLPVALLPQACLAADIKPADRRPRPSKTALKTGPRTGLDVVTFTDFESGAWAAGSVQGDLGDGAPWVLLPWNLDHPGSIVPEALRRVARLQTPSAPRARIMVLPFNYLGQTGLIRRLITQVADAAGETVSLANFAIGRLISLAALPHLHALSRTVWVEAGDPEHAWTMARLAAAGFAPTALTACEEPIWVETETRYGRLATRTAIPSMRELGALLAAAA